MRSNYKFFKSSKFLPVDKFFYNVLYDKNLGYYNSRFPFGNKGDFITAPVISNLFSEMIAIWLISTWENFGKPKNINIVELGPGDGSLTKILLKVFKKFSNFNSAKNIYLYEKSSYLKKKQKIILKNQKVKWVENFNEINKGPVIFVGNEFFDAIPIKQFENKKGKLLEKYFWLNENDKIKEVYKNANTKDAKNIKSFNSLKKLRFIEYPKSGLIELKRIVNKISMLGGCILMIDYGYLNPSNQNTLQSVVNHKKNRILNNLGKADVTSHVNFTLLSEFFSKNKLKVKKITEQKDFLKNMGIIERAEIISKKMKFSEKVNLHLRLKRLLSPKLMGSLFKVILAYKFKNNNYFGFN